MASSRWRGLQAVFRNALTWGVAWAAASLVIVGALQLFGLMAGGITLLETASIVVRFGVVGTVMGAAFAAFMRYGLRGKRLAELHWIRFGLMGALVTGIALPAFLFTMNFLSGDGFLAFRYLRSNAILGAVFGGVAAAAMIRIAQYADRAVHSGDTDHRAIEPPGPADWADAPMGERTRTPAGDHDET